MSELLVKTFSGDELISQWNQYKLTFGKVYQTEEEETMRFNIYSEKLKQIAEHNEKYLKGEISYSAGVNQFTDMKPSEVVRPNNFPPKGLAKKPSSTKN